jgi:L-amino acid N-acyltransferase YncA
MSIIIRPSKSSDLAAILAIYSHAVLHTTNNFEFSPPDLAEMARRREGVVSEGFPYLVAERAGAVVGYAYVSQFRSRPAYRASVENTIYIAPDAQRQGVGSALLAALIEVCTKMGMRQMVAIIGDPAQGGSRQLHARHGFREVGFLPAVAFKNDAWRDESFMQRALGDGAQTPPDWGK